VHLGAADRKPMYSSTQCVQNKIAHPDLGCLFSCSFSLPSRRSCPHDDRCKSTTSFASCSRYLKLFNFRRAAPSYMLSRDQDHVISKQTMSMLCAEIYRTNVRLFFYMYHAYASMPHELMFSECSLNNLLSHRFQIV
jgi:hypothetical protein